MIPSTNCIRYLMACGLSTYQIAEKFGCSEAVIYNDNALHGGKNGALRFVKKLEGRPEAEVGIAENR